MKNRQRSWSTPVFRSRSKLRRHRVGAALFRAAEPWAVATGCRLLKVETQNVNVAARRFYARQGCVLRAVHPGAYPEFPREIQLLWSKDLDARVGAGG
jgi:GNAT superfamily N-acetyltransferase